MVHNIDMRFSFFLRYIYICTSWWYAKIIKRTCIRRGLTLAKSPGTPRAWMSGRLNVETWSKRRENSRCEAVGTRSPGGESIKNRKKTDKSIGPQLVFKPRMESSESHVDFQFQSNGESPLNNDTSTNYSNWLYNKQKMIGINLPHGESRSPWIKKDLNYRSIYYIVITHIR